MAERDDPFGWPPDAGPTGAGRGPEALSDVVASRLLAQRVVLLGGPLDDFSVTRVAAELMTLDAEGDDAVTLRVDCGEAALAPSLTLMDVIELMGVPVRALCLGQVGGGAVGVVAVCSYRSALPSTRFSLSEPTTQLQAHVRNVTQWAELRSAGAGALLRPCRCRHRPGPGRGGARPAAGALPRCGGGAGLRHPRRGGPARRPCTALARNRPAAHGVPPGALITRPGPSWVPTMRP